MSISTVELMHDISNPKDGRPKSCEPSILQPRWSKSPEWLKIDKLNFEALSLHGRDEEVAHLTKSFDQLSLGSVERHLMLISGESGTGKTALAHSLSTSTAKLKGLFARGKFDFNNGHHPYSGIVRACAEICAHISHLRKENLMAFKDVSQSIKDELGSELPLLIKFIPALKKVVNYNYKEARVLLERCSAEEAKNRFQFAFLRFIRIISKRFDPLVLVLDDLHWADRSSLDLLDVCLSDLWIKKLMIIGTYRSNEVDQGHVLQGAIAKFRTKSEEGSFEITIMPIENLDVHAVNKIIRELLSMDRDELTMGLAQICFKKTQGNPFFVLEFLQMVRNSGLLKFNFASLSWTWNNYEIDSSTTATSNVVDVLKAKISQLPEHLLQILKMAACLGSTFSESCLRIIWESMSTVQTSGEGDDADALTTGLMHLEQSGYIIRRCSRSSELSSPKSYSWTHDKIQEAATMLIPMNERAMFLHDAGDILLSRMSTRTVESSILIVANMLNAGIDMVAGDEQRLKLAQVNYDASVAALSISAFESVADYARKGINLLPDDHWNNQYDLSLGLYSVAARAEGFLGNVALMEQYCYFVLSQKERPIIDKIGVYYTLVSFMAANGQNMEATDLLLNVLATCKCCFPRNPVSIAAGFIHNSFKIKSIMKVLDLDALPKSNNPMMLVLMVLMDRLCQCLYIQKDARLPLVIFRILDWTIKYGHNDYSSVAFAYTAMLLIGFLNDFKGGAWYGEQALKLIDKSTSFAARSRTMVVVYGTVFIWTKPVTQLLKPLLCSYNEGMQSGDRENAGFSIALLLFLRCITGNPLETLESDVRLYSKQMKDCGVNAFDVLICLHQATLNLMRCEDKKYVLIGDVLCTEDYIRYSQDSKLWPFVKLWEGMLSTYFGDHVGQAISINQYGHDYLQKSYPCAPYCLFDTFLKGISCFAAAKETGKMAYYNMGMKLRAKIRKWRAMGNPNVVNYESFLNAECAAFKNKKGDAISYYEITITRASRAGFLNDAALACERLAEFHLAVTGNREEARYQVDQASRYWREWGAMAKVRYLEKKYCNLPLSNAKNTTPKSQIESC